MERNLPIRKKIRLKDYDYFESGAYFLTICTKNKEKMLWHGSLDTQNFTWKSVGEHSVRPQNLPLSRIGILVKENLKKWNDTLKIYTCPLM